MATDEWSGYVVATRLRGSGSGALKLPPGTIPATRCRVQYDRLQPDNARQHFPFVEEAGCLAVQEALHCVLAKVIIEAPVRGIALKRVYRRFVPRNIG